MAHFPEVGGSFSGSRWLIFPKSVAHFPEVGGSFSGSRWLIFLKSESCLLAENRKQGWGNLKSGINP